MVDKPEGMFDLTQRMLRATTAMSYAAIEWDKGVSADRGDAVDHVTPQTNVSLAAMSRIGTEIESILDKMRRFR